MAAREGLAIRTVLDDMRDLGALADASFDVVVNPVSNVFCPDLAPVWREAFRVLRPGGTLMTGFMNPDIFIFDVAALDERDEFVVRHRIPYSTLDLPDAERAASYADGAAPRRRHQPVHARLLRHPRHQAARPAVLTAARPAVPSSRRRAAGPPAARRFTARWPVRTTQGRAGLRAEMCGTRPSRG